MDFLPTPVEAAEFIDMHTPFRTAFPDYHFPIDELIAEGDNVVVRGRTRATHLGEFPFGELKGIAPTGKQLEWAEIWIIRLGEPRDFSWMLVDGVSRLQQLGVLLS